jgi:hypothetical protein
MPDVLIDKQLESLKLKEHRVSLEKVPRALTSQEIDSFICFLLKMAQFLVLFMA